MAHHAELPEEVGGWARTSLEWEGVQDQDSFPHQPEQQNSSTLAGLSQSKPDVAATEKPYLQRNNEAIWGTGAQTGVTSADTKQVPHGQDWRWCSSTAQVKWGSVGLSAALLLRG